METKECPVCKTKFKPNRKTQVYCTTKCRNEKNNTFYKSKLLPMKVIDDKLHFNREILEKNVGKEVTLDYLIGSGYFFNLFTGSAKINNANCPIVYEFAIIPISTNNYKIEKYDRPAA